MRVRLFVEVDLDDGKLVEMFGDQLPAYTASHEIDAGLARRTEAILQTVQGVARAKVIFIPPLLPGL